ncbi:MAG TPA: TIGR03118 family protein, partial [Stellaceae bacterium]|nr:TIGR03118 family protein [Stellaceae bacterium]
MKSVFRYLTPFTAIAMVAAGLASARADDRDDHQRNAYAVTPLVSNIAAAALKQDPVLQNSWGVAFTPAGSPFWIADNNTGCSTLYDGDGTKVPLQVSIPLPGNVVPPTDCMPATPQTTPTPAAPTGVVWNPTTNPTTAFLVPGTNLPASFIFVTEDGTISAWTGGLTPANNAVQAVDNSKVPNAASGAVYKAAVMGVNVNGVFLFVTNFRAGTIEVYDHNYKLATT